MNYMIKKTVKIFLIGLIISLSFVASRNVFALSSDSQIVADTTVTGYSGYNLIQRIGEGNGTQINSFSVYLRVLDVASTGTFYDAQIIEWNDSNYSSYSSQTGTQSQTPTYTCDGGGIGSYGAGYDELNYQVCTFTFNTPMPMTSGKYYYLQIRVQGAGSPRIQSLGSASDVVDGYCDNQGVSFCGSVADIAYIFNSSVFSTPSLSSGIDKITLYTLNNEDLDTITTPIPFDAGHQIHFSNYEEDSYHYLAYNMTICHNGHLEGCTVNNETFVEDVIDISSLGFSSSGEPPLSVKLNFKDVVTQSDLVNITWFLTNCPNAYSTCPDGVSDGRGYTYLINDSLASDSWLTFDDPARPECSIARLDVCLINAVNYFIKPRTSGFANSFSVAHTRINERIPFVYLYAVRDSFTEIFNSPTASVNWSVSFGSLGSLTVLDSDSFSGSPYYSFFTGMRVYLSYLLWILLGVGLYKRAVRLFDDKTVA